MIFENLQTKAMHMWSTNNNNIVINTQIIKKILPDCDLKSIVVNKIQKSCIVNIHVLTA
jgi:hypothetical protein